MIEVVQDYVIDIFIPERLMITINMFIYDDEDGFDTKMCILI